MAAEVTADNETYGPNMRPTSFQRKTISITRPQQSPNTPRPCYFTSGEPATASLAAGLKLHSGVETAVIHRQFRLSPSFRRRDARRRGKRPVPARPALIIADKIQAGTCVVRGHVSKESKLK